MERLLRFLGMKTFQRSFHHVQEFVRLFNIKFQAVPMKLGHEIKADHAWRACKRYVDPLRQTPGNDHLMSGRSVHVSIPIFVINGLTGTGGPSGTRQTRISRSVSASLEKREDTHRLYFSSEVNRIAAMEWGPR